MKKPLLFLFIIIGLLIALWTIGRLTNALQYYKLPSGANEPTLSLGDTFFATHLIEPQRFDFICYYAETPHFGRHIKTHRLCGIEGDTIEIRNGDLYVNNELVDNKLTLTHLYRVQPENAASLQKAAKTAEAYSDYSDKGFITIPVSDQLLEEKGIKAQRVILEPSYPDEAIKTQFRNDWNQDHFGPVIVPKGHFFVLGDNRNFSEDSRYIGFIEKHNYVGTVLGK